MRKIRNGDGGRAPKEEIERNGIEEPEGFGAGIVVAEGTVGKVGEAKAEAVVVAEAFGEFNSRSEFSVETERETVGGIVIPGTETGSQYPVVAKFDIYQHPDGGVVFLVLAGTEKEPGAEVVKAKSGTVLDSPEDILVASENLGDTDTDTEQRRVFHEPIVGDGGNGGQQQSDQNEGKETHGIMGGRDWLSFQKPLIEGESFFHGVAEVERAFDAGSSGGAHLAAAGGIMSEGKKGGAKGNRIAGRDNEAGDAVFDEFGQATDIADHGGNTLRHGFEDGFGQSFAFDGGHDGDVAGAGERSGVGLEAEEMDMGVAADLFLDPAVTDFAEEKKVEIFRERDVAKGVQEDIDAFDGAHVADKGNGGGIRGDAQCVEISARGGGVPGGIVAFPDDLKARVRNIESPEIVADGAGNTYNGINAGVEIGEA